MELRVPFILASRSPRRRDLLHSVGWSFAQIPADVDESVPRHAVPQEHAVKLALAKAERVSLLHSDALVLGADTIVVHRGAILGKPDSAEHAHAILEQLSGATHTVHTGLALVHRATNRQAAAVESTRVTFGQLSAAEIAAYVATGAPMDKAGAYGIQSDLGALFVERIEGDYFNVVGLPLRRLYLLIQQHFSDLLSARVR